MLKPSNSGRIHVLNDHVHSAQKVYPTGADPVTLVSGAGAWNLGDFTQVIPASTVTLPFDLHWIVISNPDSNEDYEIVLYYGASNIEACRVSFTRTNVFTSSQNLPLQTVVMPANSRVQGKMMDGTGGATTKIKLFYHTYHTY